MFYLLDALNLNYLKVEVVNSSVIVLVFFELLYQQRFLLLEVGNLSLIFAHFNLKNFYFVCRVHEIEKRVKTPEKYLFPNYETVHWYAAKHIYDVIKGEGRLLAYFTLLCSSRVSTRS